MKAAWSLVSVCSLGHTLLIPLFILHNLDHTQYSSGYHLVCGWSLFPFHSCVIFHSMAKPLSFFAFSLLTEDF